MVVENHVIIEIAFSVYNIPKGTSLYVNNNTNKNKALRLAILLLVEYNHLTFDEIGELFRIKADTIASTYYRLYNIINSKEIVANNFFILKRYRKAKSILMSYIQANSMNYEKN